MQRYVLGVAENDTHLIMIRKNRPKWQKGKLNFVGGKIEPNESPVAAMKREFLEETGYETSGYEWFYIGKLICTGVFEVLIFHIKSEHLVPDSVKTMTDEEIVFVPKTELFTNPDIISNIPTIYSFARSDDAINQLAEITIEYPYSMNEKSS